MSITSVNLKREKQGSGTVEELSYTRKYRVVTDDTSTTEKQVLADSRIPAFHDTLTDDDTVLCKRRIADQDPENLLEWTVTCEYNTRSEDELEEGVSFEDPTDDDPRITFGSARYTVAVDKAYKALETGDPGSQSIAVQNSAGDEFDPPVIEEKINLLITIVRNEKARDFRPILLYQYIGTVNKDRLLIAGINFIAWEALMKDINGVKMWDSKGNIYYQVTYQIEGDPTKHIKKILDRGYYIYEGGDTSKKRSIKESDIKSGGDAETVVTEPQKLDGSGKLLAVAGTPQYITFYTKYAKAWKTLGLPRR